MQGERWPEPELRDKTYSGEDTELETQANNLLEKAGFDKNGNELKNQDVLGYIGEEKAKQNIPENTEQEVGASAISIFDKEAIEKNDPNIIERAMPDGTMFKGTVEEYRNELQDYRDRIA